MDYKKAEEVLPPRLLEEIQKYISGECLYIPIRPENRLRWGEKNGFRCKLLERNQEIYAIYMVGLTISELAKRYYLSEKSIYRIILQMKNE